MILTTLLACAAVYLVGFLVTLVLTPLVRGFAIERNLVDSPGPRRIHKNAVPRLGGIAVFLGFHCAAAALFLLPWGFDHRLSTIDQGWWLRFLPISAFMLAVGIMDDVRGLKPMVKLALQVVAAVLLFICDIRAGNLLGWELPVAVDLIVSVAWVLAFVNAFNLIDGLDGLASGLGAVAAVGLTLAFALRGMPVEALLMMAFFGSCLAFLRYNFNPASIFLGDSGSMFLGFTIAAIALSSTSKGAVMASIGVPLLAVGVPIFDTMLAVWRRSLRSAFPVVGGNSRGVMSFDLDHLHHRFIKAGITQRKTALMLYMANAVLVGLGLISMIFKDHAWGIFVLASVLVVYVVVKHVAYVELWDSGVALLQGFKPPNNRTVATILYPILDFVVLSLVFVGTLLLSRGMMSVSAFAERFAFWVGWYFIGLFLSRTYSRVWARARVSEYLLLALSLITLGMIGGVVLEISNETGLQIRAVEICLYSLGSLVALVSLRMLPRVVRELMLFTPYPPHDHAPAKVIVYGAGDRAMLFLKQFTFTDPSGRSERVVALVDDDLNLRGRRVFDLPVIGSIRDLTSYLKTVSVQRIVLATTLSEKRLKRLRSLVSKHGIELVEWRTKQVSLYSPVVETPVRAEVPVRIETPTPMVLQPAKIQVPALNRGVDVGMVIAGNMAMPLHAEKVG